MSRICIFGDSITHGHNDRELGGWVHRLRLDFDKTQDDLSVYDLGVSGDTTEDVIKRFEIECSVRKPKAIIFAIGLNDTQFLKDKNDYRVPFDDFKNNIEILINLAIKYTNKIGFLGITNVDEFRTTPLSWNDNEFYFSKDVKRYDNELEDICKSRKICYLKLFDLLSFEELEDGSHPSAEGHEKIYLATKDFILNIFKGNYENI